MQQFYLFSILFCFLGITNESFIEKLLLAKTEANKLELKNIKYLYACYPEGSEICGRAKNAKISVDNSFDCYDEVIFSIKRHLILCLFLTYIRGHHLRKI